MAPFTLTCMLNSGERYYITVEDNETVNDIFYKITRAISPFVGRTLAINDFFLVFGGRRIDPETRLFADYAHLLNESKTVQIHIIVRATSSRNYAVKRFTNANAANNARGSAAARNALNSGLATKRKNRKNRKTRRN